MNSMPPLPQLVKAAVYSYPRWIVVDYGTILVHIFHPEEREYYKLERLWVDDPQNCINYSKEHAE